MIPTTTKQAAARSSQQSNNPDIWSQVFSSLPDNKLLQHQMVCSHGDSSQFWLFHCRIVRILRVRSTV